MSICWNIRKLCEHAQCTDCWYIPYPYLFCALSGVASPIYLSLISFCSLQYISRVPRTVATHPFASRAHCKSYLDHEMNKLANLSKYPPPFQEFKHNEQCWTGRWDQNVKSRKVWKPVVQPLERISRWCKSNASSPSVTLVWRLDDFLGELSAEVLFKLSRTHVCGGLHQETLRWSVMSTGDQLLQ